MSQSNRGRSRSRSRERSSTQSKSHRDEDDNFESIQLVSNSHLPRSSVRVRHPTKKYQDEYTSPRSSRGRHTSHQQPESHYRISHVTKSNLKIPLSTNNMSHNEKASNVSSIINESENEKFKLVFTIGRMNPPTSGHRELILNLISLARENDLDNIGIILSPSEDNKNPLPCDKKREYILKMFPHMKINIICNSGNSGNFPRSYITSLLQVSGLDNNAKMLMIIGEDRLKEFNWLKPYFPNLEIGSLDRPEGAMSATKIRGFVSEKNKDAFNEAYRGILQKHDIDNLYLEVASGLSRHNMTHQISASNKSKSKKNGGKKRKYKTIKYKTRKVKINRN